MRPSFGFVAGQLRDAKRDGLYRRMRYGRVRGARITIGSRTLLNLCSNDYLGMPAGSGRARQMQSSSRLVSGNDESYRELEGRLARHKSFRGSLVYPTGYMANTGVIPALAGKGDLILSDELNHASIVDACRLSGARIEVYGHNDMGDLERKLGRGSGNKFVVTEGVFSMDGDYAELGRITELARGAGAITVLDDAHGDFAVGRDGRGTPDQLRVAGRIDVYVSSLSKALGSFGGYVASRADVIDLCVNRSRPFIYTSALPSFLVEHSLGRLAADREAYRGRLLRNTRALAGGLRDAGYDVGSETHIIPLVVGDERRAVEVAGFLYRNGVFVQPIRHPTVPRGSARLRISVTARLSGKDVEFATGAFERAARRFGIGR